MRIRYLHGDRFNVGWDGGGEDTSSPWTVVAVLALPRRGWRGHDISIVAAFALAGKGVVRIRDLHGGNFIVGWEGMVRIRCLHSGNFSIGRDMMVRIRDLHGGSFSIGREGMVRI